MVGEILLCALAAGLILTLLWLVLAQFLLPIRSKQAFLVLCGTGGGETLEQDCRAYLLLRSVGILQRPLLLVDAGLNKEGRALAKQLTELDAAIHFCPLDALEEILRE